MSCSFLAGAPVAEQLDKKTVAAVSALREKGLVPCLAILRVGERESDLAYESAAVRRCQQLGIDTKICRFAPELSQQELISAIRQLNQAEDVHGILLLRPLPPEMDEAAVCRAIAAEKDVDGVSAGSLAGVYSGNGMGFPPCTAQSCLEILSHYGVELSGRKAVVVGRSLVTGRPAAMLMLHANATVTLCHSRTEELASVVRQADIVIAALGKAEALGAECFRAGQIVIDVGINWSEARGRLVGDVDEAAAAAVVSALSPVPGGVGSVTTAVLASHVCQAAQKQLKLRR